MAKLIAICGPAGCGKTTAARMLQQDHNFGRLPFATPLKVLCHQMLGVPRAYLWGGKKEGVPPGFSLTGRQIMQRVGTDWFRELNPNCWLDAWQRAYRASRGPIVVDDCRFRNEADTIRSLGGEVILVERPGLGWGEHASERDLDHYDFDGRLNNSGSEEDLRAAVRILGASPLAVAHSS